MLLEVLANPYCSPLKKTTELGSGFLSGTVYPLFAYSHTLRVWYNGYRLDFTRLPMVDDVRASRYTFHKITPPHERGGFRLYTYGNAQTYIRRGLYSQRG